MRRKPIKYICIDDPSEDRSIDRWYKTYEGEEDPRPRMDSALATEHKVYIPSQELAIREDGEQALIYKPAPPGWPFYKL